MKTEGLIAESEKYIAATYARHPLVLTEGRGCKVWDSEGKEYLDFVSGIAVCNLGHCHPRIVEAIQNQAKKLIHVSNFYHIEPQIELARLLVKNSFGDRVFFCNSGAEANEAAIKLARKYAKENIGENKFEIITMKDSFHGRTMATITATGQERFQKGFSPLLSGFKYTAFNDKSALSNVLSDNTCAIMLEPIQGEGGVNCPSRDYLKVIRKICDERGILLIFDEVQVGMGRTGKLFAYENYGVKPDIMTLAKALGGGVAIGAMVAREEIAKSFSPGSHASTFGGNPLACAAGVAAITSLLEDNILDNCQKMGKYLFSRLSVLKEKYPFIKDLRGKGLIIGLELEFEGARVVSECIKKGCLINCTMGNILRFLPPLIVTEEEVSQMVNTLDDVFSSII